MFTRIIFFLLCLSCSIELLAQPKEELKNQLAELQEQLTDLTKKANLLSSQIKDDSISFKMRADTLIRVRDSLLRELKEYENLEKYFYSRPHTYIFNQCWSRNYLSQPDVKFLIPTIVEAADLNAWNDAYAKGLPAFCYHKLDPHKEYGVLLNVPAILKLREALSNKDWEIDWRIPETGDIETLKQNLIRFKSSQFSWVTSAQVKGLKWTKPGIDMFGWNLLPISFRANTTQEWYGNTSASFLCLNAKGGDLNMQDAVYLFEIDEAYPTDIDVSRRIVDSDRQNYGVYIRLIKPNN